LFDQLKKIKETIFIIALLFISWWGAMDNLAAYVNGESIKDAAIIYGVARSINGVISLLQSAELGAIVGSFRPGELLDPINDLIERFSSVMAWSLSSLVLQKILLSVFSSYSFKVIFTICCVLMLFSRWFQISTLLSNWAWSLFLIVASLRFSIALVCALTAAVDQSFIQTIQQKSLKTVQVFNSAISVGINEVTHSDEIINQELTKLQVRVDKINNQIKVNNADLAALEEQLAKEPKRSVWDVAKFKKKREMIKKIEKKIYNKEAEIQRLLTQLVPLEAQMKCVEIKKSGGTCEGSITKLKRMFSAEKITEISQKVNQTINDLITVLVSLVLTTIIIPLTFLYLFYRFLRFFNLIAPRFESKADSKEKQKAEANV